MMFCGASLGLNDPMKLGPETPLHCVAVSPVVVALSRLCDCLLLGLKLPYGASAGPVLRLRRSWCAYCCLLIGWLRWA